MPTMEIKRYTPAYARQWNAAVEASRQGTFMFMRDYMDYHADRFDGFSLMAVEGNEVKGVLPANRVGSELFTHGGLTYGGWALPVKGFDAVSVLDLWGKMNRFLCDSGIERVHYKAVPWIYSDVPSDEDLYALFRNGAEVEACQVSSAIDLRNRVGFDTNARRNMRKAAAAGLEVSRSADYAAFWRILEGVLMERYGKRPVHTLAEMELLAGRFPENIRLAVVTAPDGEMLAGVVMYYTRRVAHAQYIASSPRGKGSGALALLFDRLVADAAAEGYSYFDFGVSCERGGEYLNEGLLRQKSGFGGRGVNYVCYGFSPRMLAD